MKDKAVISLDAYNTMAEYYFSYVDTKPNNAYYERPATISLMPEVKDKNVLDAGCAAGWYTNWLIEQGANVTAIDYSPKMIEMTHRRVGDKARLFVGDLNEPLNILVDEEFDVVLSSLTLHYLARWDNVMAEFNRILKCKGVLIFSVHHPFMDFTVFNRNNYFQTELLTDEWQTSNGVQEVQFYRRPLSEVMAPLLKAGFEIEELLEPMPTEEFRSVHPKGFDRLSSKPQFLFIKARKK